MENVLSLGKIESEILGKRKKFSIKIGENLENLMKIKENSMLIQINENRKKIK